MEAWEPLQDVMEPTEESNKEVVREFYELAFNEHRPEEAASRYMGLTYRQHNPTVPDGREAFIGFVGGFVKQFPELHVDVQRVLADGDLVVLHSHMKVNPGDRGSPVVDIFRVENGKVVEHWDVVQQVPEKSANGNTMF